MTESQTTSTLPLHLGVLEVIFLADSLHVDDTDEGDQTNPSHFRGPYVGRPLLIKIGSLYLEFAALTYGFDFENDDPPKTQLPIHITEAEAWLIKSKVRSGDLGWDNTTNIGVDLTCKLFELICHFNTDISWSPVGVRADGHGDHAFTRRDSRELQEEFQFQELVEEEERRTRDATTAPNKDKPRNPHRASSAKADPAAQDLS